MSSIQLQRYMRNLQTEEKPVDTVTEPLEEAKREKVADRIKTKQVTKHEAHYKDPFGRWMPAGYHDTEEEAIKAARRAHRDSHRNLSADYGDLNDKPGPQRNPHGE